MVKGSRARTYDDDDVAQHGTYTSKLMHMHCIHLCNLILEIHFMVNWQLSNQGIRWPVPHDHIAGSGWNSSRQSAFWRWLLTRLWIFIESRAEVFSQIIRTSQTTGAPLLGSAKSIYHQGFTLYPLMLFLLQVIKGSTVSCWLPRITHMNTEERWKHKLYYRN